MADDGPLSELRIFARYARRLPGFLKDLVTAEEAPRRVEESLRRREENFLEVLRGAVYANPSSPYLPLLKAAGAELGDVRGMVARAGLEPALVELRAAGVYATLDEFKGRRPIERAGVPAAGDYRDFDNPLNARHFTGRTGGTTGPPRRVPVDLDRLDHEAAYNAIYRSMFGLDGRPFALWRVVPPNASGVNMSLRQLKSGGAVDRWFNPYRPPRDLEALKFATFTGYTVLAARAAGKRMAFPEYCPAGAPDPIVRWLAERKAEGRPASVDTQSALAVRACLAAEAEGQDISDTFFRVGGEPYTEGKAEVLARAGVEAVCHYSMAEAGRVANACGDPVARDDMHFMSDKLAVVQTDVPVGTDGDRVGVFAYTSLLPSASKVLINVESDDYGTLEERPCGCPWGELGLTTHIHGVRSHEKLTSEGNHFLGSDMYALVDRILPARFGGGPTDYQLLEEEAGGLPKVTVVVRPEVGAVAEEEVMRTVLEFLRSQKRNRLMADVWDQSRTLRVVRAEPRRPHTGAKLVPLLSVRDD